MRQVGRSGLFAAAAAMVLSACGGDAADQGTPAAEPDTAAPGAQAPGAPAEPATGDAALPEGVTPEMVAQGGEIFNTQICFSCHGKDGVGTVLGPSLTDDTWLNTDGTYEGIMQIVRTGVPEPTQFEAPMPPMGGIQLSDEQIRQVGAYVYSLSHGG